MDSRGGCSQIGQVQIGMHSAQVQQRRGEEQGDGDNKTGQDTTSNGNRKRTKGGHTRRRVDVTELRPQRTAGKAKV